MISTKFIYMFRPVKKYSCRAIITLSGSFIDPFPLIYTRQPVVASTLFRELPLGPRSRPTKLNYRIATLTISYKAQLP